MKKIERGFDLELRPHHVKGFLDHEPQPEWYYLPDKEYIARFRKQKGDFHSDGIILHWRDTIKCLHENPGLRVLLVAGLDSVCKNCDKKNSCADEKHRAYKEALKADDAVMKMIPELKLGKIYDGYCLRALLEKRILKVQSLL